MMKSIELTDSNFESFLLKSDKPVLVEFGADWCPPCQAMIPVLEALAEENDGKAVIAKLDVDTNPVTADRYGIRNLPTMLIFKGGEPKVKMVGAGPKHFISQKLSAWY